jgi:copper homeostasis protein
VAGNMGVTFHRAFDLTCDSLAALEDVIALGCERVLTSGQQTRALEGTALIRQLLERAARRIVVMPGVGVDAGNIGRLMSLTGASEFHASAKQQRASGMRWKPSLPTDMQNGELRSEAEHVRAMAAVLSG